MSEAARDVLRRVFGYAEFRGPQQDIIEHLSAGNDCLVLMPTGGGKSLCYQVPALLRPGTAVVISPLIALMQDQVEALEQLGVAPRSSIRRCHRPRPRPPRRDCCAASWTCCTSRRNVC